MFTEDAGTANNDRNLILHLIYLVKKRSFGGCVLVLPSNDVGDTFFQMDNLFVCDVLIDARDRDWHVP